MKRHRVILALALVVALPLLAAARAAGAPDFTIATDQGPLRLASLRGKVVYLDYWASWCEPCRQSFPWMNEMQARYGEKGLVVVAVNLDKDAAEARRFLASFPARFTVAFDPDGKTARRLALKGMPSSFLIDRQGQIVGTHVGFREAGKGKIENEIRAQLAR
ncbi:MAG: thiol:disulfide interchange protein [Candidatus Muproteobacteria bacterium RBG_16_62_13]|uniref:Thiol:disulfide interchange protein n=1 Tax=Candidatus Muproteobacteria bacterium RBG_16_62_13 TaxID=1817756 RepID=A0A1F6T1H4_9PROT|nr:MAG: thiol:disulfide interchange protein [Candidatus Muproteobacteria bacterium RBG_16_62_13]